MKRNVPGKIKKIARYCDDKLQLLIDQLLINFGRGLDADNRFRLNYGKRCKTAIFNLNFTLLIEKIN